MLVATVLALLGLAASVAAVRWAGVRLSGVVAVPLASVYVLYEFAMLPVLLAAVAASYGVLTLVRRRTLLFGRRLLVVAVLAGAIVPIAAIRGTEAIGTTGPLNVAFVGSILPGIAAYNYAREDPEKRWLDVGASLVALAGLVALGVALVRPTTAELLGDVAPPVLFAAGSDVAALRDAVAASAHSGGLRPHGWGTLVLFAGVALHEAVYGRWGVRLTGLVALPLVALFAVRAPVVVPLYAVGVLAVFAASSALAHRTLVYGRVLLAAAVAAGLVLAAVAGVAGVGLPGFVLLFVGLFAGIGGYNLHRTPRPERLPAAGISAAVLASSSVLFYALEQGPGAELPEPVVGVAAVAVVVGAASAADLERARRGVPRSEVIAA